MQLFYSVNSPYARKCRVLMIEKGLTSQVTQIPVVLAENPPALLAANPLGKIPTLVKNNGLALCDSPLICEYLDSLPSAAAPFFPQERRDHFAVLALAALADGLMDAAVELVLQARQPEDKRWPEWITRKQQAILRTVEHISRHEFPGDGLLNIGTLTLACALAYLHFRHPQIQWEHSHPDLDKWLAHVLKRPSFQATMPEAV